MTDQESWLNCEKTAVLQGGFLLANQLCQPEPLSALKKEDWKHIGRPIVQAVTEVCGQLCVNNHERLHWRKRILCILWSKILENEKGEDIDIRWREDPLFAFQNSLPDINHTVMFELIKSMGFFSIYVELLYCFESVQKCTELERLVKHVTRDSTEADVKFLLDVWWELFKGRNETKDKLDQIFTAQCVRFTKTPPDCSPQASKRFKPDPDLDVSTTCIMSILFQGLKDIKDTITSSEICYFALSNCLDMLYTFYLLNHETDIPAEVKLQNIARSVSLRKRNNTLEGVDLIQAIRESHRDFAAILTPAESKPCGITLIKAMDTILEVIRVWENRGILRPTNDPSALTIRLKDSLGRVLKSLEVQSGNQGGNEQTVNSLKRTLEDLLASFSFNVPESPSDEIASVAIMIIDSNLKGFEDLPKLFASKLSQTFSDTEWLNCLERNKGAFQKKELVMALVSSLISKCQSDADVKYCKKLKDIVVEIFSQLPLPDKNAILSQILTLSKKGLHGCLPSSVTIGYDEELNLAFNCIIQGEAKSSLSSAINAVARVAFQNPEATMHRCCHMAVVNLGAHTLLAQILQQLSGLMSTPRDPSGTRNKEYNLLCRCLQDTMWNKLSSPQEEDQFLCFLSALMESNITGQKGEELCFLLPEDIVHAFVLPYLSLSCPQPCRLEVCLQLFQSALARISKDDDTHWIMNCSPFALLYCLAQLLNNCSKCWEQQLEGDIGLSLESKELLISIVTTMGKAVGKEVALAPNTWSRAISWLYAKVEEVDWTVRIHLKEVWGEHFKYEVPSSLMAVSELSEQEWCGLVLPHYGQGTGLLAWIECCCLSDHIQEIMLDSLSLNLLNPEEVTMFSKGLLVAVSQVLPWCTVGEWQRILKVLHELLQSDKLHVPYSLEYVDFLPLLDLRSFAHDLQVSVFLLRMFQLLCGSSCAGWLPPQGWAHVGRLCATAMRGIIDSVKNKVPLQSTTTSPKNPIMSSGNLCQEVLFVLTQLFCHVLHMQVMMPGQPEPLFLCALDILSHYEAVLSAYPKSSTALQVANTRHFLTTITDNLQCTDMRAVLHQKIAQL
ncbi:gem-associated protein 4 [Pangasianodon hypophthalmus]|uniref:gem-associated protein 4 n=1 Tax=Pangasianodon hypophthalmus TaxID=310915 RepID=UPI0023074FBB|nr:gem-associated protein 4 [Pangasianodon hypophthalmus]